MCESCLIQSGLCEWGILYILHCLFQRNHGWLIDMVREAKGRLFRRKDGKFLLYIPKDLAEDSMFPFEANEANPSVMVKISFKLGDKKLTVEKWREEAEA